LKPSAYLVVISADSNQDTIDEALSEGAKGYIVKPFNKSTLQDFIQNYKDENMGW
jgi:response regulator of citrate/malate metabolism